MNSFEREVDRAKNKIVGFVKQTTGKMIGNEVLELKGRMQSAKADLQQKTDVDDAMYQIKQTAVDEEAVIAKKIHEAQQSAAKKINDSLDERAQKNSDQHSPRDE